MNNRERCGKHLRKTKRVLDPVNHTKNFTCIEKDKKAKYQQTLIELVQYLKNKNIELRI